MSGKHIPVLNGYEWRKPPKDIEWHYIINQVEYVEDMMQKGTLAYDESIDATIKLLAQYYRNYKKLPKSECEDIIAAYIVDYYVRIYGAEPLGLESTLLKAVKAACSNKKYKNCHGYKPLRDFDGVSVTAKEIDTIKQLQSLPEQELLFCILCFAKMYDETNRLHNRKVNHLYYVSGDVLRRCAGWKRGYEDKLSAAMTHLFDLGFVSNINNRDKYGFLAPNRQPILTYKCNIVDDDGEQVLFIDNFDTLSLTWQYILGDKHIKKCECGRYFKANSNSQKRCPLCGGPMPKEHKPITRNGKHAMGKRKNNQ